MIGWIWNASTREVLTTCISNGFGCTIGLLASFALAFGDRPFTLSIRFDPVELKAIYRPVLMAVSSSLTVSKRPGRKSSISMALTQNFQYSCLVLMA
jgi:hypothetical protein